MNTLTDVDIDSAEILLLESIGSPACENENHFVNTFETRPDEAYESENVSAECDVESCNMLLDYNKKIISSLLDLKRRITFALEKCERKLAAIERGLQAHTLGDTKALICNAGMPYFKDRNYFFPSNNEDDIIKENHRELQLRSLPKVSPWTKKERGILLKAIKDEAVADVLCSQKVKRARIDNAMGESNSKAKNEAGTRKQFLSTDILEMIGPLQEREFDWFKISSIHFEEIHSPLDCRVMWNVFLHPDINKNSWTKSEDTKLKEIAQKNRFQNWDGIAKELNTKRTAYQCFIRYNTTKKLPKIKNCNWENEEDERLLKLIEIFRIGDFIPWGEVASWMPNRTKQQVYFRWAYSLAPYLTKGRFTKTEDNILRDAVIKYGKNFRKISAALMPHRSTVQLHDRYQTLITNQIENWNLWTLSEDTKLLNLFSRLGPNWSAIAKEFSSKTRTQLRHRYTALQKYIKKGISPLRVHKNHLYSGKSENAQEQTTEDSCWDAFESCSNAIIRDCNSDIDKELIEYFRSKHTVETFVQKQKHSDPVDNSRQNAISLYNTLQRLNAKLCIPDCISDVNIENADTQLLYLLKEYAKKKNDKEYYLEFIDKCRLRMFNRNTTKEECSHFVPPPPFQSQIKQKKSKENLCINYSLNTKNKFLLEQPIDLDTPDLVISHIGGHEEHLQFQKLCNLFQVNDSSDKHSFNVQRLLVSPTKKLTQQQLQLQHINDKNDTCNRAIFQSDKISEMQTIGKGDTLFGKHEQPHTSVTSGTEITQENNIYVMDASHATLLCLKNLRCLKRLNEKYKSRPDQYFTGSDKFQLALNLLSTRFEQLFKYPIGLSNIALPEVYAMDTFSYDDITSKRKVSDMSKVSEKHGTKKIRTLKNNRKNVT